MDTPTPLTTLTDVLAPVGRPVDTPAAVADGTAVDVREVIATGGVRSVFQPIVDLDTGEVVAFEALARGPEGPLSSPAALFAAARSEGLLAELDGACRAAALRGAVTHGLVDPLMVFVNVEPEVLDTASQSDLLALADSAPGQLRIVVEITERALASRPAELLRTAERIRELGWAIALDDVGAESASLAFMALLRPEVVKLDLSLVQGRPTAATAEIMNAVNAYAERSGAKLLAEGIENQTHLTHARALGAVLGQGWFFGRPTDTPDTGSTTTRVLTLPTTPAPSPRNLPGSPFAALPQGTALKRSPKRLLVEVSKQLERDARRVGETCVVAATLQHKDHFTVATQQRYRDLVERTGFVCALGEGMEPEPIPGVRGAELLADDPVRGEWDLVVLGPHFSAALLARDLGHAGEVDHVGGELDRLFEYALTYDRDVVTRAAHELLLRVAPRVLDADSPDASSPRAALSTPTGPAAPAALRPVSDELLGRALSASTNGLTIADMTAPDQPLIFTNDAFAQLAGFPSEVLIGRNCRFLQGPDTDLAAVARIRSAVQEGRVAHETLLNHRGPDRVPWWNEVHLSPVRDTSGRVVQYIGVQTDVTARIEAEQALRQESDRAQQYLSRLEELAYTDPLTGLANRRHFEAVVEGHLLRARDTGRATALLFMDLDGFKAVNDALGHAAGDELLTEVATRLRARVRDSDVLARLGGDEFLVALTDLDTATALEQARTTARRLAEVVAEPVRMRRTTVTVSASVGIATFPADAGDFSALLHQADLRMYELKPNRS